MSDGPENLTGKALVDKVLDDPDKHLAEGRRYIDALVAESIGNKVEKYEEWERNNEIRTLHAALNRQALVIDNLNKEIASLKEDRMPNDEE